MSGSNVLGNKAPRPAVAEAAAALAELEETRKIEAEEAGRVWLESDFLDLIEEAMRAGNTYRATAVDSVRRQAQADGRFWNDTIPNLANRRAALGSDAVLMARGDATFLLALAAHLSSSRPAAERIQANEPPPYHKAANLWLEALGKLGQAPLLDGVGPVVQESLPQWARRPYAGQISQSGILVAAADTRVSDEMVEKQAARWSAMESSWTRILRDIAAGGDPPVSGQIPTWQAWEWTDQGYRQANPWPPAGLMARIKRNFLARQQRNARAEYSGT